MSFGTIRLSTMDSTTVASVASRTLTNVTKAGTSDEVNGGKADKGTLEANSTSSSDLFTIILSLSLISLVIYTSYYFWRKHRRRTFHASKLEEYRYSRLSQTEVDVDNVDMSNSGLQVQDGSVFDNETEDCGRTGPATLQLDYQTDFSSNEPNGESKSRSLIDDLSDEDLLQ